MKLSCQPLPFTSYKIFLEKERGLELISLPHFLHDFWAKIFVVLYSINWPNLIDFMPFLREIVYKKTGEWYIEWQRMTSSGTTSYNEWQWVTTSGTTSNKEWYNEWQRMTTNDKEWQRMAMSDSEWEQWYRRMDDCHHFNDKKRCTTTSLDGWLQLEWLNKFSVRFYKKVINK